MLMRFWDPENGVVRLGAHDLKDYALDDLRRRIALVAQDTYLFNDTLRANILIADPMANEAKLREVVLRASLGEFVDALPDGLDTRVGERGMRLSGGQRQRVAIARAFLKDAPVLILDEATSHLDALNEKAVRESLEELMAERTTIVHRPTACRPCGNADLIIALNEGQVIETGTHSELLARRGLYAQLIAHQQAQPDEAHRGELNIPDSRAFPAQPSLPDRASTTARVRAVSRVDSRWFRSEAGKLRSRSSVVQPIFHSEKILEQVHAGRPTLVQMIQRLGKALDFRVRGPRAGTT